MTTETTGHAVPEWTTGDRLRKAREHAGMEQAQLAAAIGVSRNSVINYEKDHTRPREIVLRAWAMATGVPVEWLRAGVVTGGYRCGRAVRHLRLVTSVPAAPYDRMIIGA